MTQREAARDLRKLAPEKVTVELWLLGWREFFPAQRKRETVTHDAYMVRPFMERHGSKPLGAITPLLAQEWTVRNPSQVRYLRHAFEKAVAMRLVPYNVWACVEMPRRTKPARPVPTLEQLDAAIMRARLLGGWWAEFADLIEFTAFTGARSGGLATLRRSAVDLTTARVVLTEKGSKRRTVVLAGRSLDAAARASARADRRCSPLLFLTPKRRAFDRSSTGSYWRQVRGEFAGPFHSLKHFAGTWLAANGVDERDIAIQLGHTDSLGRPYTHLVRRVYVHPDHEDALRRIEQAVA